MIYNIFSTRNQSQGDQVHQGQDSQVEVARILTVFDEDMTGQQSVLSPFFLEMPLEQLLGSRPGNVPFHEPQHGGPATSHPQTYIHSSQTTQANLTIATHHQCERRGSHDHSGSSPESQRLHPSGADSDTGGDSNFYSPPPEVQPHHGGSYAETAEQPQDLNAAVYNEGRNSSSKISPPLMGIFRDTSSN